MPAILIAAKELAFAKIRLSMLPREERIGLAHAMFRDVLAAALSFRLAQCVAVVTSDSLLLKEARRAGALALDERYPRGLNAAVAMGTGLLKQRGVTSLCTLLSDTPLLKAADLEQTWAAMEELAPHPGVVLVPSRDGRGTNIIWRRPTDAIPTRFGKRSLALHRAECERLGVPYRSVDLAGPGMDLDEVSDLLDFQRIGTPTHTLDRLSRLELAIF